MSQTKVDRSLYILKKLEDKPNLKKIAEQKGLNSIKPVISIATSKTDKFWAKKAASMSVHTLETYIKEYKTLTLPPSDKSIQGLPYLQNDLKLVHVAESFNDFQISQATPAIISSKNTGTSQKQIIYMDLEKETIDKLQKLKGQNDWNKLMKQLLQEREQLLQIHKEQLTQLSPTTGPHQKPKATSVTRHIPAKIKKYILSKTNNICAFPYCNKPYKILHHIDRFHLNKKHDPDRIVPLCEAHERLAHMSLIENETKTLPHWKIRKQPNKTNIQYQIDLKVMEHRNITPQFFDSISPP